MKKSFSIVLAVVAIVFSSCLGDNENTYTGADEFALIKKSSAGSLYATAEANVNFTWDGIDKYSAGDAILVSSYEVSSNDFVSGDIIRANYVNVSESFPLSVQKAVQEGIADTTSNVNNKVGLLGLSVRPNVISSTILNDRWLLTYNYNKKEGEVYSLDFIYDKSKQSIAGQTLPTNTVVVDVFINKTGEAIDSTTEKKTDKIVVNLSSFKSLVAPTEITQTTLVDVYLRYSKEGSNSTYSLYSVKSGGLYYFPSTAQ